MASWNITVEDSSPYITYSPANAWTDGTGSQAASYSGSSFRSTSAQGATASFDFRGTGIWLFGARTSSYGDFTISVDGKVVTQDNAARAQPVFKTLLGGTRGLENGKHTVVLTNTGSGIDLDMVKFQAEAGGVGATMIPTIVDDMDSSITYGPFTSDWNVARNAAHRDGTLHFSDVGGAQATYTFNGDAVAIYGTVSSDHGTMEVSIDGKTEEVVANIPGGVVLHAQTLVYWADSLGPGSHKMTITGNPSLLGQRRTGKFVDIDAIQSFAISGGLTATTSPTSDNSGGVPTAITNANGSSTGTPAQKDNAASSTRQINTGAIVGGVIGGVLILVGILAFLFFLRRRRHSHRSSAQLSAQPKTPALPIQFSSSLSPVDEEKGRLGDAALSSESLTYGDSFPASRNGLYNLPSDSKSSFSAQSTYSQASTAPLIATDPSFYGPDSSLDAPVLGMPRPPPASLGSRVPSRVGQVQRILSDTSNQPMMQRRPSQDLRPAVSYSQPQPNNGSIVNDSLVRNKSTTPMRPAVRPATLLLTPLEGPLQPFPNFFSKAPSISKPSRPLQPGSQNFSVMNLGGPLREVPLRPDRESVGIVDFYSSNR